MNRRDFTASSRRRPRWWCLGLSLAVTACTTAPELPIGVGDLPAIDPASVLRHISVLASDEFEGRAPGSAGETRTVEYLIEQFTAAGVEPGNPDGSWVQPVPLVGLTPEPRSAFTVRRTDETRDFAVGVDVIPSSMHVVDHVALESSPLVFVGYGVQAPEYDWDDFKGADVTGKTLLVLVNDPPVPDATDPGTLDAGVFGGVAMTYYGRWTYKREQAAALGAAGVFVIHEEGPAGYPFSVIQSMGEQFSLEAPDGNLGRASIEGWVSRDAAVAMLEMAGHDFDTLKARAAMRDFEPVMLDANVSLSLGQRIRKVQSQNVVARLPGRDPAVRDEHVVYTAHWDHLGIGDPVDGDSIYNGAADNASGTATLIELAGAMARLPRPPRRSVLFLAVTAEEQGLLGSEYYARFPLYPLERTVAAINLDGMNLWGRTRDMVVVGRGMSDLDGYLEAAAAEQGRIVVPDAEPEKGFYYRSDHFNFAKVGVPALNAGEGVEYIGKPPGYGQATRDEYTTRHYHAPSDDVKPDWDLGGLVEDARLLTAVGVRVGDADTYPAWSEGSEFRAVRDRMLRGR